MSYIRVSLRGTLPGGEAWSVNPCFNESTNIITWNQAEGNAAAIAIGAIVPPAALRELASTQAPLASIRVERRGDNDALIGAAEAAYTAGWAGTAGATKPYQSSVVLSLRSTTPGASGRGRLYWPALGAAIQTTNLRLFTPTPANIAAGAVSYLDGIETALKNAFHPSPALIDFHLAVVSRTTGQRHDIARIEVGDILDTQRRRRDKAVETYTSAVYP